MPTVASRQPAHTRSALHAAGSLRASSHGREWRGYRVPHLARAGPWVTIIVHDLPAVAVAGRRARGASIWWQGTCLQPPAYPPVAATYRSPPYRLHSHGKYRRHIAAGARSCRRIALSAESSSSRRSGHQWPAHARPAEQTWSPVIRQRARYLAPLEIQQRAVSLALPFPITAKHGQTGLAHAETSPCLSWRLACCHGKAGETTSCTALSPRSFFIRLLLAYVPSSPPQHSNGIFSCHGRQLRPRQYRDIHARGSW